MLFFDQKIFLENKKNFSRGVGLAVEMGKILKPGKTYSSIFLPLYKESLLLYSKSFIPRRYGSNEVPGYVRRSMPNEGIDFESVYSIIVLYM